MNALKPLAVVGLLGSAIVLTTSADAAGADINHSGLAGAIGKYGPVNGIHAYVLGSNTCNIGDSSLSWINRGTPALAMNAYRLSNGRLVQIGVGNAKTACCVGNSPNPLCGTTCSSSGFGLRPGCMDTYSAGFNAGQGRLAPRSFINPQTGVVSTAYTNTTGDAIYRRLQVAQTDMEPATYPGALYFVEGHYVCTEDRQAGNDLNNASYGRVTLDAAFAMTSAGGFNIGRPAIYAWQDHGGGPGVPDPNVIIQNVDVPGEGRFIVASKIAQVPPGSGNWHYEYAIHNLNSDRAASSFRVPLPAGANVTNIGFHDVWYHDDDAIYNGADWVQPVSTFELRWSAPQAYTQNVNANAIRWGTMYNFWFDCDRAPVAGKAEIDLFKPIEPVGACKPQTVAFSVGVPSAGCDADISRNGIVDVNDLLNVIAAWGPCPCSVNCPSNVDASGGNTSVDVNDLFKVITTWGGCP